MMLSYIYRSDIENLNGGVIFSKILKKTPFYMICLGDLFLLNKKYACKICYYRSGGWKIIDFDNKEDVQEVYTTLTAQLKKHGSYKYMWLFRQFVKLFLFLADYAFLAASFLGCYHIYLMNYHYGIRLVILGLLSFIIVKYLRTYTNQ